MSNVVEKEMILIDYDYPEVQLRLVVPACCIVSLSGESIGNMYTVKIIGEI
jgi:hypothetical protein